MKPTADFDPKVTAKKLIREARSGALATLMAATWLSTRTTQWQGAR